MPTKPDNWKSLWSEDAVEFLTKLVNSIQFTLMDFDHEAHFGLWKPSETAKGSFVSFGLKRKGKQENGNEYSTLYAFGFYYEDALSWPSDYIDDMVERAVEAYEEFLENCSVTNFRHEQFAVEAGRKIVDVVEEIDPLS